MTGRANQPRDLVWSLESFQSPDTAMKFFDSFRNSFVIYSSSVQKMYCEYTTQLTGPQGNRRMVVLPDFDKFESIFSRINEQAVCETSVNIFPELKNGKTAMMMSGISQASGKRIKLPFRKGLKALKMGYFDSGEITPILMLGDLREFPEKRMPYLKLHSVNSALLSGLSEFERQDITKGAWAKLKQL